MPFPIAAITVIAVIAAIAVIAPRRHHLDDSTDHRRIPKRVEQALPPHPRRTQATPAALGAAALRFLLIGIPDVVYHRRRESVHQHERVLPERPILPLASKEPGERLYEWPPRHERWRRHPGIAS
jgi:hypothetical protein